MTGLRDTILRSLPPRLRARLKITARAWEKFTADRFFGYGPEDLARALTRVGVRRGDTLMVHGSFRHASGFRGSPRDVVACLLSAVGPEGNLLMVSIPFRTSAYNHLLGDPLFDPKRTMSQMGIISEFFRRKAGVLRSLHPTVPVLALGKDAESIVRDHEKSLAPCGPATPFGRFAELAGKVLFFDVPFPNFTFIHYLEDLIRDQVPFPVYREEAMRARIVDFEGRTRTVETLVFSEEAVTRRAPEILEDRLRRKGLLRRRRVGRTRLLLVESADAVRETLEMARQGVFFYRPA